MASNFPRTLTGRINALAKRYDAKTYFEIGRRSGKNFSAVAIPQKLGVSRYAHFAESPGAGMLFLNMSSDEFFAQMDTPASQTASVVTNMFGQALFDVIFINGLHTFFQSFRDFENSLRYAKRETLLVLNVTVPCDPYSSIPDENLSVQYRRMAGIEGSVWHGDVFKTVFAIHDRYPQYSYCTLTSGASQTIVWMAEDSARTPVFSSLDEINSLNYFDLLHHAHVMMPVRDDQLFDCIGNTLNPLQYRSADAWKKLCCAKVVTTREMALAQKIQTRTAGAASTQHEALRTASMNISQTTREGAPGWTAQLLAEATGGNWIVPPPASWNTTGMCAWWESFKPGHMLLARGKEEKRGVPCRTVRQFAADAAGVMCTDPGPWVDSGLPVLHVHDISDAVFALAAAARRLFPGEVIAVTGTSGKTTTVGMIAHLLARYGTVEQTLLSANTLYGMAWNMAAMDLAAKWWALELAVPRMQASAPLAGPDVAVALNVSAGHLKYWKTVQNLAHYKSKIFSGLRPGGYAVINHDMELFDLFANEARKKTENIITFGDRAHSTLRLLKCINDHMEFVYHDKAYAVKLPGAGRHTAMNALAALGALLALGMPPEQNIPRLASFAPLAGRGARHKTIFENKNITIIDESYNANPASMQATLVAFAKEQHDKPSRVLILGDMLELDEDSAAYHRALKEYVQQIDPDRILLCGNEMLQLWNVISGDYPGRWYADEVELTKNIAQWVTENDVIFVKGSHGTGLHRLVHFFLHNA